MSNGNGETPPDLGDDVLIQMATSPRRISVDGVDYQGQSIESLIRLRDHLDAGKAICNGFAAGGLIRQVASPPSALGIHCGRGGRIW